jgi:hypothetical protein
LAPTGNTSSIDKRYRSGSMATALADSAITSVGMASVLVRYEPVGPWATLFDGGLPVRLLFQGVKVAVAAITDNPTSRLQPREPAIVLATNLGWHTGPVSLGASKNLAIRERRE